MLRFLEVAVLQKDILLKNLQTVNQLLQFKFYLNKLSKKKLKILSANLLDKKTMAPQISKMELLQDRAKNKVS
jgi:hypothetical protein